MKKELTLYLLLLVSTIFAVPQFAGPYDMGLIESDEITEASGLVASRQNSEVFWLHNDSGSENVIYAVNREGENLGRYILNGITMRDVEDIAIGTDPVDGLDYLYLADIGDNGGNYSEKFIYRVEEPVVNSSQSPVEIQINNIITYSFQYPEDARYDAETLLHDPNTGDLYIVTKRLTAAEEDQVMLLDYPQNSGSIITATEVATLSYPDFNGYGTTGGDISVSGLELILKTYSEIYYFSINPGEDFAQIFNSEYMSVTYTQEIQGEALAWQSDGDGYYTVSEETLNIPAHLSFYSRVNNFITIPQLPTSLYLPDEVFIISWQPENLECSLYVAENSGSAIIGNYQLSGLSGTGSISSSPGDLNWSTGIYYCVLYNDDYGYTSTEFTIIVESSQAVDMIYPQNGSEVFNTTPVFSWEATPGVPYYFLTLTDQPFTISEDENGDPVVEGMQPIWQIITSETSMMYASSDPSGFFPNNAPPLVPDHEYYWIVANNYGNDPLLSSKVVSTPVSFTFRSENSLEDPHLIYPTHEAVIGGTDISFLWSVVEGASLYYFTLYETTEESGSNGQYLIWQQTTSANEVTLPASSMLFNNHYVWNIIASNGIDANSQSETFGFNYETAIGTIDVSVKNSEGAAVGYATVELIPVSGAYNIVPFAVNSGGHEVKIVAPGQYNLISSKTNYETTEMLVDIPVDSDPNSSAGDTVVNVIMELTTSYINGNVTNSVGELLEFVNVIAISSEGEVRELSSPDGIYRLGISGGNWEVTAEKTGYTEMDPISISILPGESLILPDIILTENTTAISGVVRSNQGNPLASVQIVAEYGEYSFSATSNATGSFFMPALPHGNWGFSASKAGFTSPQPQLVTLDSFSPDIIVLNDFILTNNAGIISGTTGNGVVALQEVLVIATPEVGSPAYTLTDAYGAFSFNLLAGNYTISVSLPGYASDDNLQISISTGETIDNVYITLLPINCAISGVVTANGQPLALATVSAGQFSTFSGDNGEFFLPVAEGSYWVGAVKNGYSASGPQQVTVSGGQTAAGLNFQLTLNPSIVSGKVISVNQIIADASVSGVRLPNNNPITPVVSDAEGNYQLNLIPASYKIWSEKSGFVTAETDTLFLNVQPATNYNNQNLELTVYRSFITGNCSDIDGSSLGNVSITASSLNNPDLSFSTISDNLGNFSLSVDPDNSYDVIALKSGYSSNVEITSVLTQDQVFVADFILEQLPIIIEGNVTDQNGNPLSSVVITAIGQDNTYATLSLTDGSFQLGVTPGNYLLQAAKLGYTQALQGVEVTIGQDVEDITFILEENYGTLEGRVVNINSEPLEGVLILANLESRNTAVSDEDGNFTVNNLLPGIYPEIIFTKDGYETQIVQNTVIPPQVVVNTQVVMIAQNSSLTASITDSFNNPISEATVLVENTGNGDTYSNITTVDGMAEIVSLPALIPLLVTIQKPGYFADPQTITLQPAANENIDISMQLVSGEIFGTVGDITDELARDIRGLGGVQINALSLEGFSGSTISEADGSYRIETLHPFVTYEITAFLEGYSLLENPQVLLNENEYNLDLNMYPHNIMANGRVLNQHGNPLSDIAVAAISNNNYINAITNSSGEFTLTGLAPNHEYLVSTLINSPGYIDESILFTTSTTNGDMGDLEVIINNSILRGTIRDSNTMQPLNNVLLSIPGIQSVYSNNDGLYVFQYLPEGSHEIQISRDSYQDQNITVVLGFEEDLVVDIDLQYIAPIAISGVVKDSSERIIDSALLTLFNNGQNYTAISNTEGEYRFDEVEPYSEITLGTSFPTLLYDNDVVNLSTANLDLTQDFVIDIHSASISGIISDELGNPLPHAEINLLSNSEETFLQSEEDGSYSFLNLYEGSYTITILVPGYEVYEALFDLVDFQEYDLSPLLTPSLSDISGRVKQIDSVNLDNAVVELWQNESIVQSDTTSITGVFSFVQLAENQIFQIKINKTGYDNYELGELIPGQEQLLIELVPIPNSALGTVRYNQNPIENAEVIAKNNSGEEFNTFTNQFGDYLISGLNGYYQVQAFGDDLVSLANPVIIEGAGVRTDLELGISAHIRGRVFYQGSGIQGVQVSAVNNISGNVYHDVSDEEGNYDINGLPAGIYQLSMYLEGFIVNEELPQVTAEVGETVEIPDVTLSFQQNSIAGSVLQIDRVEIENALVTLWQNGTLLDSTYTNGNGSFLYENLEDGIYQLQASHPAYIISDLLEVELSGGTSNPSLAEFYLEPLSYIVFGMVRDQDNRPIANAGISADNGIETYSTNSDENGQYSLQLPEAGSYSVYCHKDGFEDSNIINISLTETHNVIEQNFILEEIIITTTLEGKVLVHDLDSNHYNPLENVVITLTQGEEILAFIELNSPDSLYVFEGLVVPEIYELEVTATYQEEDFYRFIGNIEATSGEPIIHDIIFEYQQDSVSLSGNIRMNHETIFPVAGAQVQLIGSEYLEETFTNQDGYYIFDNLPEQNYQLQISIVYDDELFEADYPLNWTGDDLVLNHTFFYHLAGLDFVIVQEEDTPVENAIINVNAPDIDIELSTNSTGYASTGLILPTQQYSVNVYRETGSLGKLINPIGFYLVLDSLYTYSKNINYPLQFDDSQLEPSAAADPVTISLYKSSSYSEDVYLNYQVPGENSVQLLMQLESDTTLFAEIPAQNNSGTLSLWFNSFDEEQQLRFSNAQQPFTLQLTSEGLPSAESSSLLPQNPVLAYNQQVMLELNIMDDLGNDLNDAVEADGEVDWYLSSDELGEIELDDNSLLSAVFHATGAVNGDLIGDIRCRISLNNVTINLAAGIEIKDMQLASISINGPEEAVAGEDVIYTVTTLSDKNIVMNLPVEWQQISPLYGSITAIGDQLVYSVSSQFIGEVELEVSAVDPTYGHLVTGRKVLTVYQQITEDSPASIVDTGLDCKLLLPDEMLNGDRVTSAKIFLYNQALAPYEQVGVNNEVISNVFRISSDRIDSDFNTLPGLRFSLDEEVDDDDLSIGYWNEDSAEWIIDETSSYLENSQEVELNPLPLLSSNYGAITQSDKLGISDLKLRPNPFTPNDQIGFNKGLQIEFKLSSRITRAPLVTVKIYTLSGSTVRTIADKKAMLKGSYNAGELTTLYWDGRTDDNRMARNGRYVVKVIAEDNKHREELLKTVVLVK